VPTSAAPIRLTEQLRRLVDRAHCLDHAEDRGDDPDRRQGLGHAAHGMIGLHLVPVDRLKLLIDQRLDLMGSGIADDDQPEVVADEGRQVGVFQNRSDISGKSWNVLGLRYAVRPHCGPSPAIPASGHRAAPEHPGSPVWTGTHFATRRKRNRVVPI
jgi:hypothetical protein